MALSFSSTSVGAVMISEHLLCIMRMMCKALLMVTVMISEHLLCIMRMRMIMPNNFSSKIEKVMSGTLRLQTEFEYSHLFPGKVGAGILYDKEGHVLTNAHVVSVSSPGEGTSAQRWLASKVVANFKGGEQCYAEVLSVDFGNDLALLKIPKSVIEPSNIPCDFSKVVPGMGDKFFVVGHPHGIVPFNVKVGHVSDPSRSPSDIPENIRKVYFPHSPELMDPAMKFLELDVLAGPGFSGGPLSTVEGLVFGVLHAGIPGISGTACYGIPFAIIESALGRMFECSNAARDVIATEHIATEHP